MLKPDRSVYTPADFLEWRESKALDLSPKFQRRSVWKSAAKSYFIDTLLRQMPVPPIYIRLSQNEKKTRAVREVVDGQQRVSAVLDFMEGKFPLSRTLDAEWRGKYFKELSEDLQNSIRDFTFSVEVFRNVSDPEVLEVFARLNTYSVPLNAQELRNGKFFGPFKQSAHGLAHEHFQFWRNNRILTDRRIARMLEVELTSEMMIAEIAGMQDKKKTIDQFYEKFDQEFPQRREMEDRFRRTIDAIVGALDDQLGQTEFRRPPLFYTLFCVTHHRLYGLPKARLATPKQHLSAGSKLSLLDAVIDLSEKISSARAGEAVSDKYQHFVSACLRQTDNINPREMRFKTLYNKAF